jgi:hypothetical protein
MKARVFPFFATVTNGNRTTFMTPPLTAPGLIAHAKYRVTISSLDQCIEFGIAQKEGNAQTLEVNVPIATARPYEELQQLLRSGGTPSTSHRGFHPSGTDPYDIFLGVPVFAPDLFRVTISLFNNTGAARDYMGYLKVWEEVPPDMLFCYIDP